jgi:hypothetical protein
MAGGLRGARGQSSVAHRTVDLDGTRRMIKILRIGLRRHMYLHLDRGAIVFLSGHYRVKYVCELALGVASYGPVYGPRSSTA